MQDIVYDQDSSLDTWNNLYSKIYLKKFGNLFCFERKYETGPFYAKRVYIQVKPDRVPNNCLLDFKIAGDCDFNFNDKKIKIMEQLLDNKETKLLKKCHAFHHNLCNFSFMPITGGLNNIKGTWLRQDGEKNFFDRLDLFIYEIYKYYNKRDNLLTNKNPTAINWWFSNFKDVYEYCRDIYFIYDTKFVDKLLEHSKKPLNNNENLISYMNLALEYWKIKTKTINNILS